MSDNHLYPYRIEDADAYEDENLPYAITYVHTLPTKIEITTLIANVRDKTWAEIIGQALKDKLEPKR
jgi:hypothetical protein